MTAIETIAWIMVIVGLVKILILAIEPKKWMNITKGMWKTPFLGIIYFILAAVVFYYLIQELTIIQILATMAFLGLLMGLQFARYSKETMNFANKIFKTKKDMWAKNWVYILIWVVLLVWGLKELLM